jgi:tetratricopeptide (TPR) repeat protein
MLTIAGLVFLSVLSIQSTPERSAEVARLTGRADVHRMHRRFDEAITDYRQALRLAPDSVRARRGLGRVFDLLGRHADARAEYTAGLERASRFEDGGLLVDMATSFVFERRFDDAHAALRRWADLVLEREGQDASGSPLFLELALARGDFDEAERVVDRFYRRAMPATPATQDAGGGALTASDAAAGMQMLEQGKYCAQRAVIAARRGRAIDARRLLAEARAQLSQMYKLALTRLPEPPPDLSFADVTDEMRMPAGEIAFWLGDMRRAIELLSAERVRLPRQGLLLGQAHEREGNVARARDAYTQVVENTVLSIDLAWARPQAEARLAALGRGAR